MKKSEMEKLLLNGLCDLGQWYNKPPEVIARALCLLLKPKEGWEPEQSPIKNLNNERRSQ